MAEQLPNPSNISPEIQEEAKDLAAQISKFVNRMSEGRDCARALGEAMASEHRTLQQTMFLATHSFMSTLTTNHIDGYFDARNARACELSRKMIEALTPEDIDFLPYI